MEDHATIDFETRSVADIKTVGSYLYSIHPTTEIMCLTYHLPHWEGQRVGFWHCGHPDLGISEAPIEALYPLFEYIASGGPIEAHGARFEENIWENVGVKKLGWPKIKIDQWRDSMAKCAALSLPRDLDSAGGALNLPIRKDKNGARLIRLLTRPKKLTKIEKQLYGSNAIIFHEDVESIYQFWEYNKQDVRSEMRLSKAVPDLPPAEFKVWQITQAMNRRGALIDVELCRAALDLVVKARDKLNAELEDLTGIEGIKGSQRDTLKLWLANKEGVNLPDTRAKTLEWFLAGRYKKPDMSQSELFSGGTDLSKRAKRVIEIIREVNRTSPNKYKRMLQSVDKNGRARDLIVYCGAERTGRFAGQGIQIHNLPKGNLPKGLTMDHACEDVKTRDLEWCELIYGDVMNLIVSCLRGAIIAPPGRKLMTADYSAIEARCVLWLAGATDALEIFNRTDTDIYLDMASGIFGRKITKATNKVITSDGKTERDFGKIAVLGLGYGMGYIKFLLTMRDSKIYLTRAEVIKMMGKERFKKYEDQVKRKLFPKEEYFAKRQNPTQAYKAAVRAAKIDIRRLAEERETAADVLHELALCKYTVDTYRARYAEVPAMWKEQEAAAIKAVQTGKAIRCGMVVWKVVGRFLKCKLPSGRCLNYCDPEIKNQKTAWGETRPGLRFMGKDQKTKQWVRQGTYGGKLTENITQATARDIMALASLGIDDSPTYDLILHVHDEAVTEVDDGMGDKEDFVELMTDLPAFFDGCPITAEAKQYGRYRK